MSFEITPEPDEEERRAILAALGDEEAEQRVVSPWAAAARPGRHVEESEP